MMKVLITGSSGFIGCAAVGALKRVGFEVVRADRQPMLSTDIVVGNIDKCTDWRVALRSCDVVLHLAGCAYSLRNKASNSLELYRDVNTDATLNLARQAVENGVRRFVFVSSIKVNGERTLPGTPFKSSDVPYPQDVYGISKLEAEQGLNQIAIETGMEVVIVRPPLVYGPKVKGNFSALLRCLRSGIPLPLGAVTENRRSMVALDNLVDLLVTCIDHPAAVNETFLVRDEDDLSTTDLLRRLGIAMGQAPRLIPVPSALLQAVANLTGRGDMAQRLLGNLQVDITHTCQTLGWKPAISVDEGLRRAVQGLVNDSFV